MPLLNPLPRTKKFQLFAKITATLGMIKAIRRTTEFLLPVLILDH